MVREHPMIDFTSFADALKSNPSMEKKFLLHEVLQFMDDNQYDKSRVIHDMGEDAAAIAMDGSCILVATDAISPDFVKRAPSSAGYSAILVGIEDITACGGMPLTAAIDVQGPSIDVVKEMLGGAKKAAEQFAISISRGHTSVREPGSFITSTVIGEVARDHYISAGGALPGDVLVLVWDPDGRRSPNGPFWDTVTFKSQAEVLSRREALHEIAERGLLHACKDVSDSGVVGTTFMMLDYSRAGADVDVPGLLQAFGVEDLDDLLWWVTAFLTTGFVGSAYEAKFESIKEICENHQLQATIIGRVVEGSQLAILDEGQQVIYDWQDTPIFPKD
jgi:hypothetical protein